jgi:lactate dehydrogenase-like 2-hydroxyacid dehydrogenase
VAELPRVVVTRDVPGLGIARLRRVAEVWLWPEDRPIRREVLVEEVATAAGVYSMLTDLIDVELLDAAPGLVVVSNMAVGVDNIDVAACTARGIPVGHTPGVLTETTADTAFALMMMAARRLVEGVDYVRAGKWGPWEADLLLGSDVHNTTLGIVGLGRIGAAVARRARGFGMRILYHNRRPDPAAEAELGAEYRTLDALLAEADHVVILVPLSDATRHLIGRREFAIMQPTATLVNAARGPIVDPMALYEALRDGAIAAAGLDVTDPEPIPLDDPLLTLPNCIVVPHLGSASRRTREAMAGLATDNLIAGLIGHPMRAVNPEVYGDVAAPGASGGQPGGRRAAGRSPTRSGNGFAYRASGLSSRFAPPFIPLDVRGP